LLEFKSIADIITVVTPSRLVLMGTLKLSFSFYGTSRSLYNANTATAPATTIPARLAPTCPTPPVNVGEEGLVPVAATPAFVVLAGKVVKMLEPETIKVVPGRVLSLPNENGLLKVAVAVAVALEPKPKPEPVAVVVQLPDQVVESVA